MKDYKKYLDQAVYYTAVGFGSGLTPIVPGTYGALVGLFIYIVLSGLSFWWYLFVVALGFGVGILVCDRVAKKMDSHDDRRIVWDEIVGYWMTMAFVPFSRWAVIVGFILFRVLDVLKPWPICLIDKRVRNGLGVMLDDLAAGLAAAVILYLLHFVV